MRMNDFARMTLSTLPVMKDKERLESGAMFINDHAEEVAALYARMDQAGEAKEYIKAREDLRKALGFVLVDVVQMCAGLGVLMDEVAVENLCDCMRDRRNVTEQALEMMREVRGQVIPHE